ncbi:MAG: hypothetical protein RLY86_2087 [Pseudomonadota bacterium]|jgi:hemin uptake protein HemP
MPTLMTAETPQQSLPDPAVPDPARPELPKIDSRELLGGGRELVIVHAGQEYRLRRTSQNKLILTK